MSQEEKLSSPEDIATWYRATAPTFQSLADNVTATLTSLLKTKGVAFLAVVARVKTLESILEKLARKKYSSAAEVTDLLGARVILYLESDVEAVCGLLESAFQTHPDLGVDKSEELAVDQMGYRSIHFICELGGRRTALDELAQYKGLKFEIQVRTVLQHAWAEIEHDRSYKFPGDLPPLYRRRLNLLAGTLELLDREFSTLAKDLDEYAKRPVASKQKIPETSAELDPILVSKFLDQGPYQERLDQTAKANPIASTVDELRKFGVNSINELAQLLSPEFVAALKTMDGKTTKVGILRKAMMFNDIDKYFAQAWPRSWRGMSASSKAMLGKKYGQSKLDSVLEQYLKPKVKDESRKV